MVSNEPVIWADRLAGCVQLCANTGIVSVGGDIEGKDLEAVQNGLDLRQQPRRTRSGAAVAELRRGDDADTDRIRAHFGDACGYRFLRIAGKLGAGIGVDHLDPAHRSTACIGNTVYSTSGN